MDANNCLNGIFSLLINSLNSEFISGFRLIDNFSSCFFFFIKHTTKIKKARLLIFVNLMIFLQKCYWIPNLLLLFLMLVLETILLCPSHMSIHIPIILRRQSIMLSMLL